MLTDIFRNVLSVPEWVLEYFYTNANQYNHIMIHK